jgi:drug/metabolite transporter (DMT)-like permease
MPRLQAVRQLSTIAPAWGMIRGMFFGLGSAIGFGFADLLGAISTRRIGVPTTLLVIQVVDVLAMAALLLTPLPGDGALSASAAARAAIAASGVLGTVSYFALYRALQLGPIAVVSPVFAAYAAVAVILSVLLHGERPSPTASAGVVLTVLGVVLASARAEPGRRIRGSWGGIPWALLAMVGWGVATYVIGLYAQQTGWYLPTFGTRVVEFTLVCAVVLTLWARGAKLAAPRGTAAAVPVASGLADAVAVSLFARASQQGLVSVAAAVSATFPLVVIAGGLALFHERPSARQWLGVLATVAGLIALGIGR